MFTKVDSIITDICLMSNQQFVSCVRGEIVLYFDALKQKIGLWDIQILPTFHSICQHYIWVPMSCGCKIDSVFHPFEVCKMSSSINNSAQVCCDYLWYCNVKLCVSVKFQQYVKKKEEQCLIQNMRRMYYLTQAVRRFQGGTLHDTKRAPKITTNCYQLLSCLRLLPIFIHDKLMLCPAITLAFSRFNVR